MFVRIENRKKLMQKHHITMCRTFNCTGSVSAQDKKLLPSAKLQVTFAIFLQIYCCQHRFLYAILLLDWVEVLHPVMHTRVCILILRRYLLTYRAPLWWNINPEAQQDANTIFSTLWYVYNCNLTSHCASPGTIASIYSLSNGFCARLFPAND